MRLPSGGDIHLTLPGLQHRNREMCGGAEAKQTHPLARLDAGYAQAAKADDAGAKQRCNVDGIDAVR